MQFTSYFCVITVKHLKTGNLQDKVYLGVRLQKDASPS